MNPTISDLAQRIDKLGCGVPLGSSGHINVYCNFPTNLCDTCRNKQTVIATSTGSTEWMVAVASISRKDAIIQSQQTQIDKLKKSLDEQKERRRNVELTTSNKRRR